jgi:hypothetical protein
VNALWVTTVSFFIIVSYIAHINFFQLNVQRTGRQSAHTTEYYDYRGITHSHSSLSTGSGTPADLIEAGKDAQLDFLFLTDVNMPKQTREIEGYYGRLLVAVGGEYSYLDSRLMYYGGPPDQPPEKRGQAQVYFTDLLSQKVRPPETGWVVLAHPLLPAYKWTGDYPEGLDGIEVINLKRMLDQAWQTSKLNSIWSLLMFPFNPQVALLFLFENPTDELQLWDQLSNSRKTVGFVGTDATAKAIIFENSFLRFPSYETLFSIASNHILLTSELTGNIAADRKKLMEALRTGSTYMALDIIGNPKGFEFEAVSDTRSYAMGTRAPLSKALKLRIQLPSGIEAPFEAVVYKNGEVFSTSNSVSTEVAGLTAGIYRVVVRVIPTFPIPFGRRWVPWIYSNTIEIH